MQRHFLRIRAAPLPTIARMRVFPAALSSRTYATSAPPEAEEASAQSGGSRSQDAKKTLGRTGGGEPLESSHHPPPQPKIHNASVAGSKEDMTEEQRKEVDKHNEEFEKKHDRAEAAPGDTINDKFWQKSGHNGK